MRISLIQQHASFDKRDNVARGLRAFEAAARAGAQLVAFAELAFEPFYPQTPAGPGARGQAEPVPRPITDAFAAKARELGVVAVLNLFERDGERTVDCSPVIDAEGALLGRTRMVHITEYACFHEQGYYMPGDTGAPVYPPGLAPSAWRSATTVTIPNTCARSRLGAPISWSCRRPDRWANGRTGCTRERCVWRPFRTATTSRCAI